MWRKARKNKNGEYKNADVQVTAEKIIESEKQIKEGILKLDPGMDALTEVLGKEKGGFLKGVGFGVTKSRYWPQGARSYGSSKDQRLQQLELTVQKDRLEREKKDSEIELALQKAAEAEKKLTDLVAHLSANGFQLPIFSPSSAIQMPPVQGNISVGTADSTTKANIVSLNEDDSEVTPDQAITSCNVVQTEVTLQANTTAVVQNEMVPDPPSNIEQKTTTHVGKKQKKCFTTIEGIKRRALLQRKRRSS